MKKTTLCYIEKDGCWLMMKRSSSKKDGSAGKLIGVGGKFEAGEGPDDCLLREVKEETGLSLTDFHYHGLVVFRNTVYDDEEMYLYTAAGFTGKLAEICDEGEFVWVPKDRVMNVDTWEGDRIFLKPMLEGRDWTTISLNYDADRLLNYVRTATEDDLDAVAAVEASCFPAAEAATRDQFAERIKYYGNHFWLMFEGDRLVSFVDGFVTDEADLTDIMYEDASMHDEQGAWQMIFGVNTMPEFRERGYAGRLIRSAIDDARVQGRKGLVLTCKDALVPYYASFGFVSEGVSDSTHGDVVWNQMRLVFK